jgi:hypothetical protein
LAKLKKESKNHLLGQCLHESRETKVCAHQPFGISLITWLAYCSLVNPRRLASATWEGFNFTLRGLAPLFLEDGATTEEARLVVEGAVCPSPLGSSDPFSDQA